MCRAAYISPLWGFKQGLCFASGAAYNPSLSCNSFDLTATLAQSPRQPTAEHGGNPGPPAGTRALALPSRLGASPASRSSGHGSIPAGSELLCIWEGEQPSHTLTSCFPSEAPGIKCIDNDERGRVYPGYREGQSPLLAACAGRAEVTRFAVY